MQSSSLQPKKRWVRHKQSRQRPLPAKLEFNDIKVIDQTNMYYEHRDHIIKWILGYFQCVYCRCRTTIQKSLGRSECWFHPQGVVRSTGNVTEYTFKCCGRVEGSQGCISCDHTEIGFDVTYDRERDLYPCWIEIPYAYWRSYLYDIPRETIIKHRVVYVTSSTQSQEKWDEKENVDFWNSMVWVRRYDYKVAIPLYNPPGVEDVKKK
jgi:hypothetical protein